MAYLTASQVRSRVPALANTTTYTNTEIDNLISEFTDIAERYRNVAFEPRTATNESVVYPNKATQLAHFPIRTVTSISIDGVAMTAGELADVVINKPTGMISNGNWAGAKEIVVTYTYGLDAPTEPLLRACAEYVRAVAFADRSGQGRDVIAQSMDGSFTRYSTPDWNRGRPTGFLEVDRLLNSVQSYLTPGVA